MGKWPGPIPIRHPILATVKVKVNAHNAEMAIQNVADLLCVKTTDLLGLLLGVLSKR